MKISKSVGFLCLRVLRDHEKIILAGPGTKEDSLWFDESSDQIFSVMSFFNRSFFAILLVVSSNGLAVPAAGSVMCQRQPVNGLVR